MLTVLDYPNLFLPSNPVGKSNVKNGQKNVNFAGNNIGREPDVFEFTTRNNIAAPKSCRSLDIKA